MPATICWVLAHASSDASCPGKSPLSAQMWAIPDGVGGEAVCNVCVKTALWPSPRWPLGTLALGLPSLAPPCVPGYACESLVHSTACPASGGCRELGTRPRCAALGTQAPRLPSQFCSKEPPAHGPAGGSSQAQTRDRTVPLSASHFPLLPRAEVRDLVLAPENLREGSEKARIPAAEEKCGWCLLGPALNSKAAREEQRHLRGRRSAVPALDDQSLHREVREVNPPLLTDLSCWPRTPRNDRNGQAEWQGGCPRELCGFSRREDGRDGTVLQSSGTSGGWAGEGFAEGLIKRTHRKQSSSCDGV